MICASPVVAAEFDISAGYSHLTLDGSERFHERDGFRIEPRFMFKPSADTPQLKIGFGVGISGYSHELDSDTTITIDHGDEVDVIHADQWEALTLIEPEFQVSWRQTFANEHWFVEPGLGIGAVIANYGVFDEFWWGHSEHDEWDSTFAVRPFVRVGYRSGSEGYRWSVGGEVSYMWGGDLNLTDQVHGDVR